ncbi:hypothetical protein EJV47_10160 [Hymenobacter gummosus]|uniref:Uncharacterized protein n=1 Tax=Hymenobacter gummosus TaxID=1776032 RepID=A0A3S0JAE1_9BACT|nr:hypothetical protein [Hymenobacter gummosus]RTQ49998.1 hypothetical protein EJV47_10160 [Hymenobacter gummosus]
MVFTLVAVLVYWAALAYAYLTYTLTQLPYTLTGHYFDGKTIYYASHIPGFALLTVALFALATLLTYGVYRLWRRADQSAR